MRPTYNRALHLFALFTVFCTFVLIVAGGLVTSTGSGLAVPDWPLSYGQLMPPMVGGIFYEHGHRLIATFVGLLTTILAIWLWKKETRRWVKVLGCIALVAVIVQGALGGLTVLFLLPTAISVSHATLAQSFFSLVSAVALFTSRWWMETDRHQGDESIWAPLKGWALFATGAVFVQLILGALMRHTDSGLAVPDLPLAYGQLIPSLSPEALQQYNRQLILDDIRLAADGPVTAGQVTIHMLHRMWAVVVTGLLIVLSFKLFRAGRVERRLKILSWTILVLLMIQITLGILTIVSLKNVAITTAHVAVGALLLVACVQAILHVMRNPSTASASYTLQALAGEGRA
jgi:cytochrome c oxidase assembly protein subunit 15